jgi:uroporphyrinogen-III synthase
MILITRPLPEAQTTAELLQAKGFQTIVEPMLVVEPVVPTTLPEDYNVALFTSGNGVRYVPEDVVRKQPMVLTVGDASAELAKARGFKQVHSAGGDVDALFELCTKMLDPQLHKIIHFAGVISYGALVERLLVEGFQADERLIYEAHAREELGQDTIRHIKQGSIRSALFFSPRTAKVFMKNFKAHGLMQNLSHMTAYCISSAVADQLGASWGRVVIADEPNQEAVINLIYLENR